MAQQRSRTDTVATTAAASDLRTPRVPTPGEAERAEPVRPVGAVDRGGPRRSATEAEARALASAVRLRIMRLCLDRPLTNKEIAERLGVNPATTLHHVRTLVATEFLAAQPERRGPRGAREVPYLATGKSWTLDVYDGRVNGTGRALLDAFLEEIAHLDLDEFDRATNHDDPSGFTRLGLRLPFADLQELSHRMAELLNEFALRPADMDQGVPYSIFLAQYRDVTRP
ncbi:MAG TPA: helix-turn-helix domain-containing protein [Micromonosporaceae bacterium]|nr:helix-turn-helix domain-containing protein [Micromonosporaceae bacterium]